MITAFRLNHSSLQITTLKFVCTGLANQDRPTWLCNAVLPCHTNYFLIQLVNHFFERLKQQQYYQCTTYLICANMLLNCWSHVNCILFTNNIFCFIYFGYKPYKPVQTALNPHTFYIIASIQSGAMLTIAPITIYKLALFLIL